MRFVQDGCLAKPVWACYGAFMNLDFQKTRARGEAKIVRASCHLQGAGAELIRHWPAFEMRGKSVAGFWPIKDEIDLRPLLAALADAGHIVCLPRIVRKAHPLEFRQYNPGDSLKAGAYGTAEPFKTEALVVPDVVLLPLLAFTGNAKRLGYGGGFYDRTIAALRSVGDVLACGVAYAGQQCSDIPTDKYDQHLDAILTPSGYRKF